jgi:hypothetical protein
MCGFCHDPSAEGHTPKTIDNRFISQRFKNRCKECLVPKAS